MSLAVDKANSGWLQLPKDQERSNDGLNKKN